MSDLERAVELIEAQQKEVTETDAAWFVGEQLKDMLHAQPEVAGIVAADLAQKGMGIADCEKKIDAFAQKHRKGNRGVCGPKDSDRIIRKFYGIPAGGVEPPAAPVKRDMADEKPKHEKTARRVIRLADFL